jgi:hypothetical protein
MQEIVRRISLGVMGLALLGVITYHSILGYLALSTNIGIALLHGLAAISVLVVSSIARDRAHSQK